MEAGTGAGIETRTERRVDGRESPGTYEVVVEMGRRTQQNSDSRKAWRPSETIASCGGSEPRNERQRI